MLQHQTTLRVRYDECDPMGLVHHSNYLRYFEIARTELLRASGGRYRDMEAAGQLVVVAHVDCRYRSPARYDDLITIDVEITKVTAAKILHRYRVTRAANESCETTELHDATELCDATVTLAVVDRDGRLQRVPESLVEAYENRQAE